MLPERFLGRRSRGVRHSVGDEGPAAARREWSRYPMPGIDGKGIAHPQLLGQERTASQMTRSRPRVRGTWRMTVGSEWRLLDRSPWVLGPETRGVILPKPAVPDVRTRLHQGFRRARFGGGAPETNPNHANRSRSSGPASPDGARIPIRRTAPPFPGNAPTSPPGRTGTSPRDKKKMAPGAIHRTQIPHPRVRHLHPAPRPLRRDTKTRL
jgi:hypothetical protein